MIVSDLFAGSTDFQDFIIFYPYELISLQTLNDAITLEYDDRIALVYEPHFRDINDFFEEYNEFVRYITTVHILDNDSKYLLCMNPNNISYDQAMIILTHRYVLCLCSDVYRQAAFIIASHS